MSFAGGLPVEGMDNYRDFPIGFGAQSYYLGNPIEADWLASLHPRDRRQVVVDAINGIGPAFDSAAPSAANPAFLRGVQDFLHETATTQVKAVLVTALRALADPTHQTRRLLAAIAGEALTLDATPEDRWLGDFCAWISDGRARIVRPVTARAAGTSP